LAPIGGILVSESVHRNLGNKTNIVSTFIREEQLKNVREPVKLYQVHVKGVEPMVATEPSVAPQQVSPKAKNPRKMAFATAGIILFLLLSYFLYSRFSAQQSLTDSPTEVIDKSIAVLPFVNMSDDPSQEYFSDGLSEELLNLLAKIPELKVIGRTSSFAFKGKNEDLRNIGKQLGVSYLLEGSVRKSGNNLRITTQLIKTEDGSHLWSETYDRTLVDIFAVQDDIAGRVVDQLKLSIPGLIQNKAVSTNIDAYNLLLEANYIHSHQGNQGTLEKRIELMERAIALDSTDARIWAGLAKVYRSWGGNHIARAERVIKARKAAEKAISLEEDNAIGHYVLGEILWAHYWDWENAEKEFKRAEELSPEYAGARSIVYVSLGKWEEAIIASKRWVEVDPVNPEKWRHLGGVYLDSGKPEEAIPCYERALELNPNLGRAIHELGISYMNLGQYQKALEFFDRHQGENSRFLANLHSLYYQMGNIPESNLYLEKLLESDGEKDNSFQLSRIFATRGEADQCFEWLQIAYERKHPAVCFLKSKDLPIKDLNDPRYNQMLKKLNLPLD
jgi:TolB-like protein/Tfp pilus assembly protein PilF